MKRNVMSAFANWYFSSRINPAMSKFPVPVGGSGSPNLDQDVPENHPAKVRKMSDIVTRSVGNARQKFYQSVADHEILRLDRHREEKQNEAGIGKHHPESEKDSEHRTRSADDRNVVQQVQLRQLGIGIVAAGGEQL